MTPVPRLPTRMSKGDDLNLGSAEFLLRCRVNTQPVHLLRSCVSIRRRTSSQSEVTASPASSAAPLNLYCPRLVDACVDAIVEALNQARCDLRPLVVWQC